MKRPKNLNLKYQIRTHDGFSALINAKITDQRHRLKTNDSISKSLAHKIQWRRPAAGMEAVGASPGVPIDIVNV
jgi:hypothetical protein